MNIKSFSRSSSSIALCFGLVVTVGCGSSNSDSDDGAGSEIATSVVSGALNNSAGSAVSFNELSRPKAKTGVDWLLDKLNPVGTAWAATWTCSGGSLNPAFAGPGPYSFTPLSCEVTWGNNKTASSVWSGAFNLNYGTSCDSTHEFILNQGANCELTRTTDASGNTRTLTGPDGNSYSVTHNTNGSTTGWDSSVTPAPNNNGVIVGCGASGCTSSLTLSINGSHLTGTVTPSGGTASKWWDHTVSTAPDGVNVTVNSTGLVVSGTVVVQHNLAKFTSTTVFNNVQYSGANCCFPSAGSVSTTFSQGPHQGKTESLTFGTRAGCGEATLTRTDGSQVAFTLEHCI